MRMVKTVVEKQQLILMRCLLYDRLSSGLCIILLCISFMSLQIWWACYLWFTSTASTGWKLSPFSGGGKWDTKRLRNLPQVPQLGDRVSMLVLSVCMHKHCGSSHSHGNFFLFFLNHECNWCPAKIPNKLKQRNKSLIIWTLGQISLVPVLALPFPGCVTLAKSLNFPVLQFSPL